jgi:hypothetical protein
MAKGKHSAALFEVINSTKRPEAIAQSLRTPKWWFKGSQTPSAAPAEPPSLGEPEPALSAPDPTIAPRPGMSRSMPPASNSGRSSAVHLGFNRERQELTLRLRYTTALVSGFFLCVVIGGAYVIGRHLNRGPQAAVASTQQPLASAQYLRQTPQAGVTDVTRQRLLRPAANPQSTQTHRPQGEPQVNTAPRPPVATLIPASAVTTLPRVIGLNYTIIQTYPESEQKAAEAACDFLNKNGIPCSLEKTEYVKNPNWVCLVGTAGFTRISSGDYRVYVDHILALAEKFPTSRFNRFDPKPFKWRG